MKFYLLGSISILILILQFNCKHESKEPMNKEKFPRLEPNQPTPNPDLGAPILQYKKDKIEISQLTRNTKSELENSVTTRTYQEEIVLPIFSHELFQFDVPIRKDHPIPAWKYEGVDSLAAISDVEGNYYALVAWLKGNKMITEDFKWSFGDNHLVINGDVTDRGDQVFQVLWLIYKLEQEAEEQGGKVHFVLGNHEQINIQGFYDKANLMYVHPRYAKDAAVIGIDYANWLSDQTELGRWIRTKNAMIQIDDELFVHGGISTKLIASGLTIQEINEINRSTLNIPSQEYDQTQSLIARKDGPLWYRGLADEDLTQEQVLEILDYFNSKRIIIGHTIVREDRIEPLYNGSVIPIDLPMKRNFKAGIVKGVLITKDGIFELDNKRNIKAIDRLKL